MSKAKPTTKEQLIHYLLSNISLGTYDRRFLSNLEAGFLGKNKPITTNQAALLNKIVSRYARQLSKNELDYVELTNLEWNRPLVESATEYVTAFAQLSNDKIIVRTPYKSGFIKELRGFRTAKWFKEEREWHINYNEKNLKAIVLLIADHYETINFCEKIKGYIDQIEQYESIKVWNPTLCKVNDRLIIASINEPLYEALTNIQLEVTPKCFAELSSYGIEISDDLMTDDLLRFAGSLNPQIEKAELSKLEDYLPAIGCEHVVLAHTFRFGPTDIYKNLIKRLAEKNITVYDKGKIDRKSVPNYVLLYTLRVITTEVESHAAKMIHIANSEPVEIK